MKRLLWALFSVFLCLTIISPASALVWNGSGHDYHAFLIPGASWEDVLFNLHGQKYLQATITSEAEQNFIMTALIPRYDFTVERDLWIGGLQSPKNDPKELNSLSWVAGEEWGVYSNWALGEPNDYYSNLGMRAREQFLSIRSGNSWKWNTEGDFDNISGYVMETASVPEPGTILLLGFGLLGIAAVGRKKFL